MCLAYQYMLSQFLQNFCNQVKIIVLILQWKRSI